MNVVKNEKTRYIYIITQKKLMIIIPVKNSNSIEQALKAYKFKIYKTKQLQKLQERKEYKKFSVKRRAQLQKAKHIQKNHSAD